MIIVDSHCHLFSDEYENCLGSKLKAASSSDVKYFLSVCTEEANFSKNLFLAGSYEGVFASVGIHPYSRYQLSDIDRLVRLCSNDKVVAIGEIGLDYYRQTTASDIQRDLLESILDCSRELGLPYIFHARSCFPDIFPIIDEFKGISGVFHCYTDSMESLRSLLDKGFYVSFSGAITFEKSGYLREIVKYAPLDRVLVETDCPYLTPVPHRGRTNEPSFVRLVAECIAEQKGMSLEQVAEATTNNFFSLFKKAVRSD